MAEPPPTALSGQGHPPYEEEFRAVGHILERDAKQIMERWYERASKEQVHADSDQRGEVMNELLHMLQSLGQRLQEQSDSAMEHGTRIAREHGRQRSGLGWDIVELVRDYEILHSVVLEHLGKVLSERLSYRQAMILATVLNRVTGTAVEAFSEMAQQRLEQRAAQLRRLTMELAETEQRERRRVARLLHDNLQQLLVATQIQVGSLRSEVEQASLVERIGGIQDLLNEASEVSRSLTGQLSPPLLYEAGFVAAVQWLARQMLKNHQLTVHFEVADEINIPDEPTRVTLFDSVRELLLNVVKHAQVDEAWVHIEQTEQWVRVSVEDRGAGYEAPGTTGAEPAGFGLTNVRERMEWFGGSMHVDAAPSKGTRIVLEVPRHPTPGRGTRLPGTADVSAMARASAVEGRTTSQKPGRRIRVVVADDHRVVREGLVRMIQETPDFEVVAEAGDGIEAIEMAHGTHPDVIVMDVTMPQMNGVEATRRLARELPDVRIIGLSVHADEDMGQAMRDAGAERYLSKTGPTEDLLAAIRHASPAS